MERFIGMILCAAALSGCASAQLSTKDQAQCGPRPTEPQIQDSVQTYIKNINWKDPDSVHVQNIRMQECRAIWNGLLAGGGHTVGWEIDFDINAKNSYGGFTGFQLQSITRTADGMIHWQNID
jgi:hypothetical protein